jgi:hypothetical protein
VICVLGGRPVTHLATLWYAIDSSDRTGSVPVHQAGEAHSIFSRMTVRVRCCTI